MTDEMLMALTMLFLQLDASELPYPEMNEITRFFNMLAQEIEFTVDNAAPQSTNLVSEWMIDPRILAQIHAIQYNDSEPL